jgi:hypothetical protein
MKTLKSKLGSSSERSFCNFGVVLFCVQQAASQYAE